MQDKPRFIEFVDKPYNVTFSQFGYEFVRFEAGSNTISVDGYRKVCVEVSSGKAGKVKKFALSMGKISGSTLCTDYEHPAKTQIYCHSIKGPQISLILYGPPNESEEVQLWVYLMP
jgi:hypothetical protein